MNKVNILGVEYDIKFVPYISRDELLVGQIDYFNQEILILEGLSKDLEKVTLLHEILHGVFTQLGFYDESNNEHLIQSIASAFYQVLCDNNLFY